RRDDFYKKELSFQVSCSYGPGRYDEEYENKGHDYPLSYVRWTEIRNFETILYAISNGSLNVDTLITEKVPLDDYLEIYGDMRKKGSVASILCFSPDSKTNTVVEVSQNQFSPSNGKLGIIGAGNFTSSTVIPSLKKAGAEIKYIASAQGLNAKIMAKKANAQYATSDYNEILNDKDVNTVLITTRHNMHARMVMECIDAGKNVFVEKPLCLNADEIEQIIEKHHTHQDTTVTVGFNRRFSPFAQKMKTLLGDGPKNIIATMNAGFIPADMWVQDMEIGGGRIIGEACHFIDLCSFIAGSKVISVCMNALGENPQENTDNVSILLKYANGSNAVINYFANGSKSYQKERVEVFSQEKVLIMDNWRSLKGYGFKNFSKMSKGMDKGHNEQFSLLTKRAKNGGEPLITFDSIVNTTKASFACIESLKEGKWIDVK
ncbi:MAG: Gfo/Idh/MocA family oxidoreductase, partial [Flavobacteriales bacterium]|nr:Gfo/Idh/MocA family oxidoreductase [Flavobacteriales bacterium]